jgi:hypothetical protein
MQTAWIRNTVSVFVVEKEENAPTADPRWTADDRSLLLPNGIHS